MYVWVKREEYVGFGRGNILALLMISFHIDDFIHFGNVKGGKFSMSEFLK